MAMGIRQTLAAAIQRSSTSANHAVGGSDPSVGNVYMNSSGAHGAAARAPPFAAGNASYSPYGSMPPQTAPGGISAVPPFGAHVASSHDAETEKDRQIEQLKRELRKADEKSNFFRNQVMALQQQVTSMDRPVTADAGAAAELQRLRAELAEERAARQRLDQEVRQLRQSAGVATTNGAQHGSVGACGWASPPAGVATPTGGHRDQGPIASSAHLGTLQAMPPDLLSRSRRGAFNGAFRGDPLDLNENPGGPKRALIVGCDYAGKIGTLRAGVADAQQWARFFLKRGGFNEQDIRLLSDDPTYCQQKDRPDCALATRDNILRALHWLVARTSPGDQLFFVFCGHGAQVVTEEYAGKKLCENAIVPTDICADGDYPRVVSDTDIHKALLQAPAGAHATLIFDSCHSGQPLDRTGMNHLTEYVGRGRVDYDKLKGHPVLPRFLELERWKVRHTPAEAVRESYLRCQVVQWCACANEQFCVELPIDERPRGVFTYIFICALLKVGVQATSNVLLQEMRVLTGQLKGRWRLQQDVHMALSRATTGQQPFMK